MSSLGKWQETEGNSSCIKSDIIIFSEAQVSCSLDDREKKKKTSFASEEADRLQEAVEAWVLWHGTEGKPAKLSQPGAK